jgi:hypothetical protein
MEIMNENNMTSGQFGTDPVENALRKAFFSQSHPSADALGERVLGTLGADEAGQIDEHLNSCPVCRKAFEELQEEAVMLDSYMEESFSDVRNEVSSTESKKKARIFTLPVFKYAAAAVLVIGLFYSGVSLYPELVTPKRYTLGDISSLQITSITRGLENPQLQEAQFEIQNKNFDKAISLLESYTRSDKQDVFYVDYLLGLTYLHAAKQQVAFVIPHYREDYLIKAKERLLTSIRLNTNPQLANISLDAAFYAAKAAILLGQPDEARQLLTRVISEKGSMMDEAKNLIGRL